jgi:hypothetical protein
MRWTGSGAGHSRCDLRSSLLLVEENWCHASRQSICCLVEVGVGQVQLRSEIRWAKRDLPMMLQTVPLLETDVVELIL